LGFSYLLVSQVSLLMGGGKNISYLYRIERINV
jgi:hypothetical protein